MSHSKMFTEGIEAGQEWAANEANAAKVQRLINWGTSISEIDCYAVLDAAERDALGLSNCIARILSGKDLDREDGIALWSKMIGKDDRIHDAQFLRGFIEGAVT